MAFVVSPGTGTLRAVPLGAAASIEAEVESWRRELEGPSVLRASSSAGERSYRLAGTRLRQRIWDPLTPHLGSARTVLIVPDGALNLVSFAAMPTAGNRYLADDGPVVHLVSAERDLVLPAKAPTGRGLLAVGGASYDVGPTRTASSQTLRSGCGTLASLRFEDLPGSRAEVQDIAGLWTPSAPKAEVTVLNGHGASEAAVVRAVAGRRIRAPGHSRFLSRLQLQAAAAEHAGRGRAGQPRAGTVNIRSYREPAALHRPRTRRRQPRWRRDRRWRRRHPDGRGSQRLEPAGHRVGGALGVRHRARTDSGRRGRVRPAACLPDCRRGHGHHEPVECRGPIHPALDARALRRPAAAGGQHGRGGAEGQRGGAAGRAGGQSTHPFYWAAFVAAGDWR